MLSKIQQVESIRSNNLVCDSRVKPAYKIKNCHNLQDMIYCKKLLFSSMLNATENKHIGIILL